MKKSLILPLLLFALAGFCQTPPSSTTSLKTLIYSQIVPGLTGSVSALKLRTVLNAVSEAIPATPTLSGILYEKYNWVSLADFVDSSSSATVVGGAIRFSNGNGGWKKALGIAQPRMQDHWIMEADVIPGPVSDTLQAVGFGPNSSSDVYARSLAVWINLSTIYTPGGLYLASISNGIPTELAQSASGLPAFAEGDSLHVTLQRDGVSLFATVVNRSNPSPPVSVSYTYSLQYGAAEIAPNTGRFSVFNVAGSPKLIGLKITSQEPKNAALMVIGDSKTVVYAGTQENRYGVLLGQKFRPTIIHGGASDDTGQILRSIQDIISLAPKEATISIGTNDFYKGRSVSATFANYANIVAQLTAANIRVVHLLPFYEESAYTANLLALKALIQSTYAGADIIDCWTPMSRNPPVYLSGDGLHPSPAGHTLIYETILNSGKIRATYNPDPTPTPAPTSGSGSMTQYAYLFVAPGASNMGGFTPIEQASVTELSERTGVQIINGSSSLFAPSHVGVNNYPGLRYMDATHFGIELQLANRVAAGSFRDAPVFLVKCGQGGATFPEWQKGGTFWNNMVAKVDTAKKQIRAQGKVPVVVFVTDLGFNDGIAGYTSTQLKDSLTSFKTRLREQFGFVPILFTEYARGGTVDTFNPPMREVVAGDSYMFLVSSLGLSVDAGGVHFTYGSMKTLTDRIIDTTLQKVGEREAYLINALQSLGAKP
ncbi:GDSL-type esterase/lipase family protein [Spirosoma luteum]|uniref:GDSL-type esterase/lipase family protein n=1 Tax=Spirosoma luteum TaxID=431553 RepID=UPI0003750203|nr:GDSL-type esterase/lipase family protein [Spirosoma luteum]